MSYENQPKKLSLTDLITRYFIGVGAFATLFTICALFGGDIKSNSIIGTWMTCAFGTICLSVPVMVGIVALLYHSSGRMQRWKRKNDLED